MLYLLGGAPRSGKSLVARRLLRERGLPYFPTDALMMGLRNGLPELGLPSGDPRSMGERLWPVVRSMIMSLHWTRETYLLEGDLLLPEYVALLRPILQDELRACWLGYADIEVAEKVAQLRAFPAGPNDWLRDRSDEEQRRIVGRMHTYSNELRDACVACGFPYYDGSRNFLAATEAAFSYLARP
jgi:hypothetical protein